MQAALNLQLSPSPTSSPSRRGEGLGEEQAFSPGDGAGFAPQGYYQGYDDAVVSPVAATGGAAAEQRMPAGAAGGDDGAAAHLAGRLS